MQHRFKYNMKPDYGNATPLGVIDDNPRQPNILATPLGVLS